MQDRRPCWYRDRYDDAITAGRQRGETCAVIAKRLGVGITFVIGRSNLLGLPRVRDRRAAGMSEAQKAVYRLFRRKGFRSAEANAAALGAAA